MNPFLARMGYGPDDRVLILHIDDMGFCHAANAASLACLTEGSARSATKGLSCGFTIIITTCGD